MKVAIYIRISKEQKIGDTGLELQEAELEQFAKAKGFEVYQQESEKNYIDVGFSGQDLERPELKKLLRDAELQKFDGVLVYKVSQIARTVSSFLNIINEFECQGVWLMSATETINTQSESGKIIMKMYAVFEQCEREAIARRIKAGLDRAKRQGKTLGRPKVEKT